MSGVPASSHGLALGGTIRGPLVVDLSAGAGSDVPLEIRVAYNTQVADALRVVNTDNANATLTGIAATGNLALNDPTGVLGSSVRAGGIGSGLNSSIAYATAAFVSGTARQVSLSSDAFLVVPVTFNPTAGAAATCKVEVSPDNVNFATLVTMTEPAGIALDGTVMPVALLVHASWYVKLTVTNATLATGTYF